jgi:ferritin-like metal-binding protein YciE
MKVKNFNELFEIGLRYAYDTEQKLVEKGIPSMIEAASSAELRTAFEQHLEQTRTHVTRLERIFAQIGVEPKTEDDDIIDEITEVAKKLVGATEDGTPLRDAVLVIGGGHVEHYEMAVYSSLQSTARQLGLNDAATLLGETLNEEKAAAEKLVEFGEKNVKSQGQEIGGRRAA